MVKGTSNLWYCMLLPVSWPASRWLSDDVRALLIKERAAFGASEGQVTI